MLGAAAVYLGAFALRFDGDIPVAYLSACLYTLPIVVALKIAAFMYFGLHRGMWAHVGMDDLFRIIKVNTFVTVGLFAYVVFTHPATAIPRSIFFIDWLGGVLAFGGVRFAVRLLRESYGRRRRQKRGVRTLIAGAGRTGEVILRQLRSDSEGSHLVVGFLDDTPSKQKLSIHGVSVLGTLIDAPDIIRRMDIHEILIAMPQTGKKAVRNLIESCRGESVEFRTIPAMNDFVTGDGNLRIIREVRNEDLLDRDPVQTDVEAVRDCVRDQCVLITGAGGSIGSEIARQVAALGPRKLVLFDMAESALFEIDSELQSGNVNRVAAIGDLRNGDTLERLFQEHKPEVVYHAAAYKHVPLMEAHPEEAVLNNVRGTRILTEAASRHGVGRFVMISSDKAVRPSNVMGITKRICELVVSSANGNGSTCFSAVRFGNVLGSNGSVVPIFQRQIEAGGPLTVTHPEMTRYFMTIREAVALVLQCGAMPDGNSVFVLDMGTPVKIMDLAKNMITLSGYKVGKDIEIKTTGLRPGEKLHEELVTYGEKLQPSARPGISRLEKSAGMIDRNILLRTVERLEEQGLRRDTEGVKATLERIIALDEKVSESLSHPADQATLEQIHREWEALAKEDVAQDCRPRAGARKHTFPAEVLLIDDDERSLRTVEQLLSTVGVPYRSARSGAEARELLMQQAMETGAVLCDYCLGDCRGDELLREVRTADLKGPFVLMTGFERDDFEKENVCRDGFDHVLFKPFTQDQLMAALVNGHTPGDGHPK